MEREEKMLRKLLGFLKTYLHLYTPDNTNRLDKVISDLVGCQPQIYKKIFVMTVGYSKSGKTTLIKHNKTLSSLFRLSTTDIHDRLNAEFSFLRDDNTVNGRAYWERQYLTRIVRKKVLRKVFAQGIGVINDSANLSRYERKERLSIAKKNGYKTIIVWVVCDEKELIKKLEEADDLLAESGKEKTWLRLYQEVQKKRFNPPLCVEADEVVKFESAKDDPEAILQ